MQNYIRSVCSLLALACFSMATQAITLTGVQLRKPHAGTPLDVPVDLAKNISGAVTVESRATGAGHQIVFQFDTAITVPATASATDEGGAAVALAPPVANGNNVIVTIPTLADGKRVRVLLTSVNGSVGADFAAAVGFLIGDTNNSGSVTAADTSQVKSRAGQLADASNAKFDFNASGAVNAADIATVKARQSRTLLPAYTLGGTVTGLSGSLVLQNNGGNTVTITANGSYAFPVAASGAYNVTVLTQPAGQSCTLTNNVGTIASASVANISVSCATAVATTIYDIKGGVIAPGTLVQLSNQLVTGIKSGSGFFLQVKSGDPAYTAPPYSGIFVFTQAIPAFAVGNRVSVTGTVQVFNGEIQLAADSITVVSAISEPLPLPVLVANASDIATGGPLAQPYEGVIARISNVQVTAQNSANGEFTVGGVLVVDDFLFLKSPLPNPGDVFQSLTGIVATIGNISKLLPGSAADFVVPTPTFGPASTFIHVGDVNTTTFPTVLTLSLGAPAFGNTFVPITSSSPGSVSVQGGGVTVLNGQASATVILSGIAQNAGVTLTATVAGQMLTSNVRVIAPAEQAALVSLTPPAVTIPVGGGTTFTVALDIPAPAGGALITLSLSPANAGAIPATVTVPANQLTASFGYADAGIVGSAQITATRGAITRNAVLTISNVTRFVINEVDYDQIGTDNAEFVELYNGTASAINLADYSLVFVNGGVDPGVAYLTVPLTMGGTLAPGQYFVAGGATVIANLPLGVNGIVIADGAIQNGSPDGIALVNTAAGTLVDSLSYEGSIIAATLGVIPGTFSLVRGTPIPVGRADSNTVNGSLCRFPNGTSTDNDATDWSICSTPTPGIANASPLLALISLTPSSASIQVGSQTTLTVNLNIAAPAGGTVVSLVLSPANAGTIPATVTVPQGALSAIFSYTEGGLFLPATISATLASATFTSDITVQNAPGKFVINEVDYDQLGVDAASFVELFNGTNSVINLTGLSLVLINGNSSPAVEYMRFDLTPAGTLAPGQYLVVGNSSVINTLPGSVRTIDVGAGDFIQNGAPDGIALIDTVTQTVLDSFSYEGAITLATITGFPATVNLVRGTALPANIADPNADGSSLCRFPNGTRTDNDATDWRLCTPSTPGAQN